MRRWRGRVKIKKEQTDQTQTREKRQLRIQTIDHKRLSTTVRAQEDTPRKKGNPLCVYYESYIQKMEVKVEEEARSMKRYQIQMYKYTENFEQKYQQKRK